MVQIVNYNSEVPSNKMLASSNRPTGNLQKNEDKLRKDVDTTKKSDNDPLLPLKISPPLLPCTTDSCATGKFGWEEVKEFGISIPYIIRGDKKFLSTRIVYHKVWSIFTPHFSDELFECIKVQTAYINVPEGILLNEINYHHCDCAFGTAKFTSENKIMTVDMFKETVTFLNTVFDILIMEKMDTTTLGFIRIDKENMVPFVTVNEKKVVPIFYFDGESQYLESKSFTLNPTSMMYMRFCCKLQEIKKEHYDVVALKVVYVEDLLKVFPATTVFEVYWPEKMNLNLLKPFAKQLRLKKYNIKTPKLQIVATPQGTIECLLPPPSQNVVYPVVDGKMRIPWPLSKNWSNPYSRFVVLTSVDIPKNLSNPYVITKTPVLGNVMLTSINLFPFLESPKLVSLLQVNNVYFNFTSLVKLKSAVTLIGLTLYTLNSSQSSLIESASSGLFEAFVDVDELKECLETINFYITNTP